MDKGKGKKKAVAKPTSEVEVDFASLPRVSSVMSSGELREECKVRNVVGRSRMTREVMLDTLRIGSVAISFIPEYRKMERIYKYIEEEETKYKAAAAKQYERKEVEDSFSQMDVLPQQQAGFEASRVALQNPWDISFKGPATPKKEPNMPLYLKKEPDKRAFPIHIRKPTGANQDAGAVLKYVVYSSDAYESDGFHGSDGPPDIKFHGSFETKEDANLRAQYVFYFKNVWGLDPNEMAANEIHVHMSSEGLLTFSTAPPDSSVFTVSAVTCENYRNMNSSSSEDSEDDYKDADMHSLSDHKEDYGDQGLFGYRDIGDDAFAF
mmetsp:Transcript_14255/g.24443  ORF Transcript_14255/g.24443 Transcript_14255/m.24443 type:complete len:322 (+) Transcript_14255:279-1244(+)